jgi:hypothetical protein
MIKAALDKRGSLCFNENDKMLFNKCGLYWY